MCCTSNRRNTIALASCLIFFLQILLTDKVLAITYTFIGNGDWNISGNWDANGIPPNPLPNGSAIVITSDCTLTTNLTLEAGSSLTINIARDLNVTVFDITNSGTIYMYGSINSDPGFDFTNNSSGLIINGGVIFAHGKIDNTGTIQGNGRWYVSGSDNINTATFQIYSGGEFNLEGGNYFDNSGVFEINSPALVSNFGTFNNNSTLQINGTFENGDMFDPGTLVNNGIIKGTGTLHQGGTVTNNSSGSIAPGLSPGKLTVSGNINFGSGTFSVEINGTGQGTTYDWLSVSGTATIGGSSKLNIVFGYTPTVGATYDILTATTVSGSFTFPANVSFSGGNVASIALSYPGGNTLRVTVMSFNLLPVEFISFDARTQFGTVMLNWKTASEQNNRGFEVQRSSNGRDWKMLGLIPGNGTTTELREYVFMDKTPLQGINYYRLRQVDFDDNEDYSPIKTVELNRAGPVIRIFPNPATSEATVSIDADYAGDAAITIFNAFGTQISTQPLIFNNATSRSSIELAGLPTGIYLVELKAGHERWRERLIIK